MKKLAIFYWFLLVLGAAILFPSSALHAASEAQAVFPETGQFSHFPLPLSEYQDDHVTNLWEKLSGRIAKDPFNLAATLIFFLAICHTFLAIPITKMAHHAEEAHHQRIAIKMAQESGKTRAGEAPHEIVSFKATILHFLGEVEATFGIWVLALIGAALYFYSWTDFQNYVGHDRNFVEPLFVVVIMAIAASRPVVRFAEGCLSGVARLGGGTPSAWWISTLILSSILGSFITEPAAMTIAALVLSKKFYHLKPSKALAYGTIGLLFVNISVGGTLTNFAAPPVLMVAAKWNWSSLFMLEHFGYRAVVGIVISTLFYFLLFRKDLAALNQRAQENVGKEEYQTPIPAWIIAIHLVFLAFTVFTSHYPPLFIGGFLFFLAFVAATRHHQIAISLRSPLLVGFFLAALVIHGGLQSWWIAPILTSLNDQLIMLGSTLLTAFNDNAAITYLASTVPDLTDSAKHAVVAGAVTGGGLTVIANAPNPAGQSILQKHFDGGVSPLGLFLGALIPTIIVYLIFLFLPVLNFGLSGAH